MSAPHGRAANSTIRNVALLAGGIAALYLARRILIPLAIAFTLAFLLTPLVTWLQKIHFGRIPAVIIVVGCAALAAGGLGSVIASQMLDVLAALPSYRQNIDHRIEEIRNPQKGSLGRVSQAVKEIGKEIANTPPDSQSPEPAARPPKVSKVEVVNPPAGVWRDLKDMVSPLVAPVLDTAVVIIFTIFLLVKKEDLRNRLLRLGGVRKLNVMTEALDDAANRVSRYLFMLATVDTCFGVLVGIGLYFIGLPNAALWGVLAGLLRLVPYVGTTIAAACPILLSLAVFSGWLQPLLVIALYAALEITIANFIEPWLYGTHTGISPLPLLIATILWATLWGPAGLLLSTPLTVCLVVLGSHVPQLSFLQILLGDEPVLAPEAQLYQRLLAMDQVEAREIADQFLKERSLTDLYDAVLIPALSLAEQDRHNGALDQNREEFLFLNMSEMIEEFSERGEDLAAAEHQALNGRLFCFPVSDEADQIAAAMLAQLLEQSGWSVTSFPAGAAFRDLLSAKPAPQDVIFLSAVPPFALAHSKQLYKLLRSRLPNVPIVLGIWGYPGDVEQARTRFEREPPPIFTSLAAAVQHVADFRAVPSV